MFQREASRITPGGREKVWVEPITRMTGEVANLRVLLDIEADIRDAANIDEWKFIVANETRKLTRAKQVFVFKGSKELRLMAISGLPGIERSTPLVSAIETIVEQHHKATGGVDIESVEIAGQSAEASDSLKTYPFKQLLWVPFLSRNKDVLGGMVLASGEAWLEQDQIIIRRLAGAYAYALAFLQLEPGIATRLSGRLVPDKSIGIAALMILLAVLIFPVSMSTLAPFEVAPRNPFIVAAPLDGVIADILVTPNEVVKAGQPIVTFADTILKNGLELAEKEILVASAELKKAGQLAFDDQRGGQNLRLAMANHALKVSERNYAADLLGRATIIAQDRGVALYSDKRTLIGRPVKLGERIMQIADPENIELLIDVAVNDAIILKPNARVKIFLDSDPINAREGVVRYIEYQARERSGKTLSFRVVARLLENQGKLPRLGVRGTAQLYGKAVPLAFYLFRRPLMALRQWAGI